MDNKLTEITTYLFSCRFDDPTFDADDSYEHSDKAEALVDEYGWGAVFDSWFEYLRTSCLSPEDVINFANLFFYYGGADYPVKDPYPFLSYLYYRVDTALFGGEATDIFDSIAIPMLSRIGAVSLELTPDYVPEKDPRIIKAVFNWKTAE